MVDLRAIYTANVGFDRVALIGYFISVNESTRVGSFDRLPDPCNEPTYVVGDAILDERDAIKAKFCVIDRCRTARA